MSKFVVAIFALVLVLCAVLTEPPTCAKRMATQGQVGICVGG